MNLYFCSQEMLDTHLQPILRCKVMSPLWRAGPLRTCQEVWVVRHPNNQTCFCITMCHKLNPGTLHLTPVTYIIIKLCGSVLSHLLSFHRLHIFSFFFATLPQVSFPDQTPYFIGRNLQSAAHPVEMMKWSWSTMKVTFGRWTSFIFITGVPVRGSFDKTWNASPAHGFCDKCLGSSAQKGI